MPLFEIPHAYGDDEFPMYSRPELELRAFLKDRAKGNTLFACMVGVARSAYLKRVAEQEGVSIVGMHKSVMFADLLYALSPTRQSFIVGENGITIPDIGTIQSVIIACNEADEREIAIEVGKRLSSKGVNVSYVYGTEGDLP